MYLIRPSSLSSYWNYFPFRMRHLILLPKNLLKKFQTQVQSHWEGFSSHFTFQSFLKTAQQRIAVAEKRFSLSFQLQELYSASARKETCLVAYENYYRPSSSFSYQAAVSSAESSRCDQQEVDFCASSEMLMREVIKQTESWRSTIYVKPLRYSVNPYFSLYKHRWTMCCV